MEDYETHIANQGTKAEFNAMQKSGVDLEKMDLKKVLQEKMDRVNFNDAENFPFEMLHHTTEIINQQMLKK